MRKQNVKVTWKDAVGDNQIHFFVTVDTVLNSNSYIHRCENPVKIALEFVDILMGWGCEEVKIERCR